MNINSNNIDQAISEFKTVSLKDTDKVKFLKRSDTKYVFHRDSLMNFLNDLISEYKVLKIEGIVSQDYKTIYYDTDKLEMYMSHHNGLRDRYKVRCRQYLSTGETFLEIKKKNNKNVTSKKRILTNNLNLDVASKKDGDFIAKFSPFIINDLTPIIESKFTRLTLVNEDIPERITIDYNLHILDKYGKVKKESDINTSNLCIAEIKRNAGSKNPVFDRILKKNKIYTMGFSKYCMGISFINTDIKTNNFKPRIQVLKKNKIIY